MEGVYTIDIDLQSGEAFVGLVDIDGNVQIARIDSGCSNVADGCFLPIQGTPNFVFVDQNRFGILPFSIDISQASISTNSQIGFSIDGANSTFDRELFFSEKTEIEGEPESSEQEVEIDDSRQKIQIWGNGDLGIRSVKFGTLPGLAHEINLNPSETIRLPRFSWSSSGVKTDFVLFIGRENGQIDKYIIDSSELIAKSESTWVANESIPININPLRANEIKGICTNETSPSVFISSKRGVIRVNSETMKIVSFIKTPADFEISLQNPKDVLWGISKGQGSISKISLEEIESLSSQSSESTVLKTTSSSVSSISSSSISSSSESTETKTTSSQSEFSSSSKSSSRSSSTQTSKSSSSLKLIAGTHWTTGGNFHLTTYSAPQPTAYNSTGGVVWISFNLTIGPVWVGGGFARQYWTISGITIYSDSAKTNIIGGFAGPFTATIWNYEPQNYSFSCGSGIVLTFRFGGTWPPGGGPQTAQAWWS